VEQVTEDIERANEKVCGKGKVLRFSDGQAGVRNDQEITASKQRIEKEKVARPEGIEPPTLCLEGRRSIRLSYGRVACIDSKSFIAS
jgi:hypothetical protein